MRLSPRGSKPNAGRALHLTPTTLAVAPLQAPEIQNSTARGDGLKNRDLAEDFEVHMRIVPALLRASPSRITSALCRAEGGATKGRRGESVRSTK